MNFEVLVDLPPATTFTRYVCVYQKSTIKSSFGIRNCSLSSSFGVRNCSLSSSFGIRNRLSLLLAPKTFDVKQKLQLCFSHILFSLYHYTDK